MKLSADIQPCHVSVRIQFTCAHLHPYLLFFLCPNSLQSCIPESQTQTVAVSAKPTLDTQRREERMAKKEKGGKGNKRKSKQGSMASAAAAQPSESEHEEGAVEPCHKVPKQEPGTNINNDDAPTPEPRNSKPVNWNPAASTSKLVNAPPLDPNSPMLM